MIINLSNIGLWSLKFGGKESRRGSSCTTATNIKIMAQPTEQRDRGVKVIEVHYPISRSRQLLKQIVDNSSSRCKAFDRWNRVRAGLVRCRMEVPDVSMVCQEVELKSLLDGLARHLVGILGSSCGFYDTFVDGDMSGRHSIVLGTVAQFV